MSDPDPNRHLIRALVAGQTVAKAYSILMSQGVSEVVEEALELIFEDIPDAIERAYLIDFIIRHGGVTLHNFRRCSPVFHQRTNKCSKCNFPGHNKNHCPGILF